MPGGPTMRTPCPALQLSHDIERILLQDGIRESRAEAMLIVEHVIGCDRARILSGLAGDVALEQTQRAYEIVCGRLSGAPLAHILGYAWFYSHRFRMAPGVMVPRPETEILVDESIKIIDKANEPARVLDLYTGCGNVILSVALEKAGIQGTGVDIDPVALDCARLNLADLECDSVLFLLADAEEFLGNSPRKYHLVTANPPYIPHSEIERLQPEVRLHENSIALNGGADGLDHYRMLAGKTPSAILPGGTLLAEIGAGQEKTISGIFSGWSSVRFVPDLNGISRVLVARP